MLHPHTKTYPDQGPRPLATVGRVARRARCAVTAQAQPAILQGQCDPCPAASVRFDKAEDDLRVRPRDPHAAARRPAGVQRLHQVPDQPPGVAARRVRERRRFFQHGAEGVEALL